jgi:hypothetical protein
MKTNQLGERQMTKTIIKLCGMGGELSRVELTDEDATTEAIAQAAIDLIAACMSLRAGDTIKITEE